MARVHGRETLKSLHPNTYTNPMDSTHDFSTLSDHSDTTSMHRLAEASYVSILEMMISKNHLYFVVLDRNGNIVFQNIPNGKNLRALDDLSFLLKDHQLEKIKRILELSLDDAFEFTIQEGLLEFTFFCQSPLPNYYFLQVNMKNGGDSLSDENLLDNQAQAEKEFLDMQMVQAFLLELKELESIEPTEIERTKIREYFLPELERQKELVKDPLTLICLDIIQQNLDEIIDTSGIMGKLYKVLTPSEIKVAEFIRMGMSSKDIANTLEITQKTVENHRNSLREKLGLKNKGVNLQVFLMNLGNENQGR